MEQYYGSLSDLSKGCDFGPTEESIVRDVLVFTMRTAEIRM